MVNILLATYNGSEYVNEMIDSILSQDYTDWHLILSDDGSNDSTPSILQEYANKTPEKIEYYKSGKRFGNPQQHFMHLLDKFSDSDYVMFCDQDDVWHKNKISKTLEKMKSIEETGVPVLVHTDLRVVDKDLNCIHPSFVERSGIDVNRIELKQLIMRNVVTGCTMMMNRELVKISTSNIPENGIMMHDWLIAIIAAAFGKIGFVDEATIDYRQHGNNSLGSKNTRSMKYLMEQVLKMFHGNRKANRNNSCGQAAVMLECYSDMMDKKDAKIISEYAKLAKMNGISRRCSYIKNGFWKDSFLGKVGQIILG